MNGWIRSVVLLTAAVIPVVMCAEEPLQVATASAMARVTKKVAPDFPPAAKQLNLTGQQDIAVVISATGEVEEAKVVKGNAVFSTASLTAIKQWKFTPLLKDGQPTKFATVVMFNYTR
ncbi:MAG TPA: energy transducer TonB [Paludibaculum sp.]|jgi:TonB family protein